MRYATNNVFAIMRALNCPQINKYFFLKSIGIVLGSYLEGIMIICWRIEEEVGVYS